MQTPPSSQTACDQDKFEDCVAEIGAFLRGGLPGMAVLEKVYKNIIKHFGMARYTDKVLGACNLYVHSEQNRLKRKRSVKADEEMEFHNVSQM